LKISPFATVDGKAEVTKQVRAVHHEEKIDVVPLSLWGSWSDLAQNFMGLLFPHSHPSAKFCPNQN